MRRFLAWCLSLLTVVCLACACHRGGPPGDSCAIGDDGRALDVSGRGDGLYGLEGDVVGAAPLARFERVTRQTAGVDETNGKRWIRVHLADVDARALEDFTATASPQKGIVVIAGGSVASRHKVRTALRTADLQMSCCDPRACDRWEALLSRSLDATTD